jgi:hypothetical protein
MRILFSLLLGLALAGCGQQETTTPTTEGGTTTSGTTQSATTAGLALITATPAPLNAEKGVSDALMVDVNQDGKPVQGAKVSAKTSMPAHNMQGPDLQGTETAPGKYRLPGDLMKGEWQFDIKVELPGGATQTQVVKAEVK